MRKLIHISVLAGVLICFGQGVLNAQQTIYEESTVVFQKSLHGGIHIHPKGWGAEFYYGDIRSVDRTIFFGGQILGMKHPKEEKQITQWEDANAYAYGKLNSFYIIRPTIGVKRRLTEKYRKSGVEVSLVTAVGPSLGLTKPVYLEINRSTDPPPIIPSTERYDPNEHGVNNILGRSSSLLGFDEIKLWPGAHVRAGLYFELSPYQKLLKGVETGMVVDAYLKPIPIMAIEKNNQVFHSFYINLFIGRKYTRNIGSDD